MKQTIDLLSSGFAVDLSKSYSLSIRQLPDGYSFSVTDNKGQKCLAIKHIKTIKSANELSKEPLLQLPYRNICYIGYGNFAMVPKSLISEDNYKMFLPIDRKLIHRATTVVNLITKDELIISHSNQWTIPNYVTVEPHHEIELLAMMALQEETESSVWTEIVSDKINIAVISHHKIILLNSYSILTEHDAAYYVLACYQQLELSQEDVKLFMTGDLQTINPTIFLKDYIRNIEIITPSIWNDEFNNDYASFFTLQTKQHLICE